MKFICSKSDLLNGVNIVSKAVPNKTTMSILQCILIDARYDEIKLIANDMELGIETIIEGDIEETIGNRHFDFLGTCLSGRISNNSSSLRNF